MMLILGLLMLAVMGGVGILLWRLTNLLQKNPNQGIKITDLWKSKDTRHVVADLDKILVDPVYFVWRKKQRKIKPIDVEHLLRVSEALARLDFLRQSPDAVKQLTTKDLLDAYHDVIKSVCDDIPRKELDEVNLVQLGAMIQLIMDSMTGKINSSEKKNKQGLMLENSPFKSMLH